MAKRAPAVQRFGAKVSREIRVRSSVFEGAMAASGDDDTLRVVDVKHGKDRHEIAVDDAAVFTARHLMDKLLDVTGVLQKNQKLLAKGKVLEADLPLAAQVKPRGGRATIMLMASAGGGGGAPRAMTAGEAALAASRAAKAAKLAEARKDGLDAMVTSEDRARARRAKEAFAANEAARRAAWGKTGVVGLREAGLEQVPSDVWDLGTSNPESELHPIPSLPPEPRADPFHTRSPPSIQPPLPPHQAPRSASSTCTATASPRSPPQTSPPSSTSPSSGSAATTSKRLATFSTRSRRSRRW